MVPIIVISRSNVTAVPRKTTANTTVAPKSSTNTTKTASSSASVSNFESAVKSKTLSDYISDESSLWSEFDDTPTDHHGPDNWSRSFSGLGNEPFPKDIVEILNAPTPAEDIEITPDGLLFLPEIKYRRMLNKTFGPGGWGLAPRSQTLITPKAVSREYGLICHGRLVAVARGEQQYFSLSGIPTAIEGCKSNAMMRCCKDLGIASELWDPRFIREFKKKHCDEKYFEKKKRMVWKRKDTPWEYPYK